MSKGNKGDGGDGKKRGPTKSNMQQIGKNFLIGGLSGMTATSVIQPVDMLKVRIQLASEAGGSTNPVTVARSIFKLGGVRGFYAGLDSALLRQAVYATMRLGIYFNLSESIKNSRKANGDSVINLSVLEKTACSFIAGSIGSFVGTPCDLVLVRMQADKRPEVPIEQRRNYKNVFDAFSRVIREEGVRKLWTGGAITVVRACSMNMWMLVSYDESKERLRKVLPASTSDRQIQIYASLVASVFTSCGTLPFDNVKTKLQNQRGSMSEPSSFKQATDADFAGKPYRGILDCFMKTAQREGVTGLWAGLPTFYLRVGPHAVITLLTSEVLRVAFKAQ